MTENRDIATVFGDVYSRSAPKVLGDQHGFLLDTLESYLRDKENPTLLVLGSGGQVLPHSCQYTEDGKLGTTNRERIKRMIGNGKIVLLDYLLEESKNGLEKGLKTLDAMGFFDQDYFVANGFNTQGILNPKSLEQRTVSFLLNNLREDLRITDESVTAIDANLSIHHASVTRSELERIYRGVFRILQPGGFLHLGEGNVDMNYTEDKLIKIGQDISSLLHSPVLIRDEREKGAGYIVESFFKDGVSYGNLPIIDNGTLKSEDYIPIKINEDGLVTIEPPGKNRKSGDITENLKKLGYKKMLISGNSIAMPLIDIEISEDNERHIKQVNRYYDAIADRVRKGYLGLDDRLVENIITGITVERNNALRGTVEYYMGEERILNALKKVGFTDIEVVHHEIEPFYNITAVKPK